MERSKVRGERITCAACKRKISENKAVKVFELSGDGYKFICPGCLEKLVGEEVAKGGFEWQ